MTGVSNLHRLAVAHDRLCREALAGPCRLHPDRPAVAYVEGWDLHPKGACEACAAYGEAHGYAVHRAPPAPTPTSVPTPPPGSPA